MIRLFIIKKLNLNPEETGGQYCFIKVIIKQKGDTIIKEEIMECADGRKKFDGLSYWDLFVCSIITTLITPILPKL